MLEISVIRGDKTVWEYNSLTRKQKVRLYNVAAAGLATLDLSALAKGVIKPNFNLFNPLFMIPGWVYVLVIGLIVATAIVFTMIKQDWSDSSKFFENILYLIIALLPGIYVILVMLGVC